MLFSPYYAKYYAGIIDTGLVDDPFSQIWSHILLVYAVFQGLCYNSRLGFFSFKVGVAPDNQSLTNAT